VAGLRGEVRAFLAAELAAGSFEPRCDAWLSGHSPDFSRRLAEQGWVGMTWPKRYGGHERSQLERYMVLEELLAAESASGDDDRAFNLKLAFCRYLPPDARLGLLERRRAHLVERLARARASIRAGRERMDAYTRSLMEHGTEATERDISWLDSLIATERRQGGTEK